MGMGMGMGMQQNDHQNVNYGIRTEAVNAGEGEKRDLLGWSMLEGSVVDGPEGTGGVVGVENLGMRNDQSVFNSPLPQPPVEKSDAQEKDVKIETTQAKEAEMAPAEDSVAGRWDFDQGMMQEKQSTCPPNTDHQSQQQQQQSADQNNNNVGCASVEESEGQSMEERWCAWEEEKQQAKEASSRQEHKQGVYFYRECQRNMAAEKGCTVVDGCGEFMPCSDEGGEGKDSATAGSLLCAACECHRSFHRRVLCDKDGFAIEGGEEGRPRQTYDCIAAIKSVANEVTLSVNQTVCAIQQHLVKGQGEVNFSANAPQPYQFEQSFNVASFLKNLDGLRKAAKSMMVTADCLTTLQCVKKEAALNAIKDGGNSDCSSSLLNQFKNGKYILSNNNTVNTNHNDGARTGRTNPLQLCESAFNERKEKRKRTRFSTEQITKLNDFAMEVGWTLAGLTKEDIDAVCENVGIEPTTLKYWLYNTRQKSKRRHQEEEISQSVS
ncbi:uncharacterized protein LOC131078346 [Cryptomeria japonica]|uniref:uncharacterized protein LOC131078346 n=1 Tax=Cryptomeria japonica TaxID=3369 RepID=UPI0027DA1049|nr:uncharacterized protein LOC131078346 [Cryptomeria japonica]